MKRPLVVDESVDYDAASLDRARRSQEILDQKFGRENRMAASQIREHKDKHFEFVRNSGRLREFNSLRSYLAAVMGIDYHDVRVLEIAKTAFPMHENPILPTFVKPVSTEGDQTAEEMLESIADGSRAEQIDWIHRNIDAEEVGELNLSSCPGLKAFKTWKMLRGNRAAKLDWLKEIHKQGVKEGGREESKGGGMELKDADYLLKRIDGLMEKGKLEGLVS